MYQTSMKNELHQGRANSHSYKLKMTSPCNIVFKSQTRPVWLLKLEWHDPSLPPLLSGPHPLAPPPPPATPYFEFCMCMWTGTGTEQSWTPSTRV